MSQNPASRSLRQRLGAAIQRAWAHRGPLAWCMRPVAVLYGAVTGLNRSLYRLGLRHADRLPVPVLVVGNVVAGGAGKTPTVMALVRHLRQAGWHPAVLSRGHGRSAEECLEVSAGSLPGEVGDEPLLIHCNTGAPVFVARRRSEAGLAALHRHPGTDVLICDDGLQHLALHRDVEVCAFDDRGLGNGWLLPAGPLREPWPRRVDIVLHTGNHPAFPGFRSRRTLCDHGIRPDGSRVALRQHHGRPVLALAAIAAPENFFAMLRSHGIDLERTLALPDHWDFGDWDASLQQRYQIVCTEKDAVKLWRIVPDAIAVPLAFEPETGFFDAVDRALAEHSSAFHGRRA
ncbi:MAG: tetraacyldisaccharide 4'-kinase [Xylophilus ampelinus]